jgi:hypothetical protein
MLQRFSKDCGAPHLNEDFAAGYGAQFLNLFDIIN